MEPAQISVVIPALNASATLPVQLKALMSQTSGPPFEVIVVDNGSTDGTGDLAATFESAQFTVRVVPEEVRGINSARNAGAAAASTGRVLLCDADDEVWDGWVAAMSAALTEGTWVSGALDYTRLNSPTTRRAWNAPDRALFRRPEPYVDPTYGCNCGFTVEMWERIGRFDTRISGTGGDETEFFMRAHHAGYRRVEVPNAIVSYRLRPGIRNMVRQRYRQGRNQVLLRRLPGGALLPGTITWRGLAVRGAKQVAALPTHLWSAPRRNAWLSGAAGVCGRVSGLWRHRSA